MCLPELMTKIGMSPLPRTALVRIFVFDPSRPDGQHNAAAEVWAGRSEELPIAAGLLTGASSRVTLRPIHSSVEEQPWHSR